MSSLSGNVKNHNTAVSPPAYEAGGDRVADERAWADAYEAALLTAPPQSLTGFRAHAEAHRRQAELLADPRCWNCGRVLDGETTCPACGEDQGRRLLGGARGRA